MTASARRRSSRCSPTPRPMAARRSSASTPMRPRCFLLATARSRSSARCASPFSTIRPSRSARAPARPRFVSIGRSRPRSTAAWWRLRARRTARSSSMAPAPRRSGRSKCVASTRTRRSTGWRRRARSMGDCPTRSAARWRRFTPAPARSKPGPGSRRSPTISSKTTPRSGRSPTFFRLRRSSY